MARLSEKLALHAQKPAAPTGLDLVTRRDVLTELRLGQIEPDPEQPRKELGDLSELSASIRELGVITAPGGFFGEPSAFRLGWTSELKKLPEGLNRLAKALELESRP